MQTSRGYRTAPKSLGALRWLLALTVAFLVSRGLDVQAAAFPEVRLALVIGNLSYDRRDDPEQIALDALPNAEKDAEQIAEALNEVGFTDASGAGVVRPRLDLDAAQLAAEVEAFEALVARSGDNVFAVVYFSGHGAALSSYGDVALLPVGVRRGERGLLKRGMLAEKLLAAGARNLLIVLDMCRDLEVAKTLSPGPDDAPYRPVGLKPGQDFLIAYAASPDRQAFDGRFARVLAEEITRGSQNLDEALAAVSSRVTQLSYNDREGARQKPVFDNGLSRNPPCFVSCNAAADRARFTDCPGCPWIRVIQPGQAQLGSPADQLGRDQDEMLPTTTTIEQPFAIGVYELTVEEWEACVRDGACPRRGNWTGDLASQGMPASHLSYSDAIQYLAWLSRKSGLTYRLPTEEEWEYAARAGAASAFSWGDDISPEQASYNYSARYGRSDTRPYVNHPQPVTDGAPNAFKLYQMSGNVWEWTSGCVQGCKRRVVRGGAFDSRPADLRLANRFFLKPDKPVLNVGLRVARSVAADEGR